MLCLLKTIFYFFNLDVTGGWELSGPFNALVLTGWSLLYDGIWVCLLNLPFFFLLFCTGRHQQGRAGILISGLFAAANSFCLVLNAIDIFYYPFHQQRADADLLYVLKNPFEAVALRYLLLMLAVVLLFVLLFRLLYRSLRRIQQQYTNAGHYLFTNLLLGLLTGLFFLTGPKKVLPTYPLTSVSAIQLPLVQNSLHTFIYSLYRRNETLLYPQLYMPTEKRKAIFDYQASNAQLPAGQAARNVVLFIMESIPADFFEAGNPYKVRMPFLDSLVSRSTYFSNAISYSHNSNKGITAMLAGIPTLVEIPLYHSNFTSIEVSPVGKLLAEKKYSSAFFIGDNYDDFGFAKCCNWLGIQRYYCMQDVPGHQQMDKHAMGLHDEYVLPFMAGTINTMREPFFAVNFNISTHFPNDLPRNYREPYPQQHFTSQMKSMSYYNKCLERFFGQVATMPWYKNTVFIFCSDHWMYPDAGNTRTDIVESFRIPVFIFDPGQEQGKRVNQTVSQLDILNTVFYYAGVTGPFTSYGHNLLEAGSIPNRVVFSKENNLLYQAMDSSHVLQFNALTGQAEFGYNYRTDPGRRFNLVKQPGPEMARLLLHMKAFLQAGQTHYKGEK